MVRMASEHSTLNLIPGLYSTEAQGSCGSRTGLNIVGRYIFPHNGSCAANGVISSDFYPGSECTPLANIR